MCIGAVLLHALPLYLSCCCRRRRRLYLVGTGHSVAKKNRRVSDSVERGSVLYFTPRQDDGHVLSLSAISACVTKLLSLGIRFTRSIDGEDKF